MHIIADNSQKFREKILAYPRLMGKQYHDKSIIDKKIRRICRKLSIALLSQLSDSGHNNRVVLRFHDYFCGANSDDILALNLAWTKMQLFFKEGRTY